METFNVADVSKEKSTATIRKSNVKSENMPNEGEPSPNQQDSDDNIYDDFVEFNFSDKKDKYEDNEKLNETVNKLLEQVNELTKENEELKKVNENLNKNISSLLKTAKNEVQRKDSLINQLRLQVDSLVFKRQSKITKDKFTETENWNYVCKCREKRERSKSKESRVSEVRDRLKNEEKKNSIERRDENYLICDTSRSDYYKEKRSKSPEKYRGSSRPYKLRDRSYEGSRKSFRYNYKDHLKYDSLDKRRHSDSSRSSSRKRSSREKESSRRESRDKRKRTRSHSKERSQSLNTRGSSSGKHKDRFSSESVSKTQKKVKSENSKIKENSVKNESSNKEEKKVVSNFEGKSALDGLYDENLSSWDSGRQYTTDWKQNTSEIEEGECVDNNSVDDWMLSFKNERQNTTKPLTLYSRRMMKKFAEENSKEKKETEVKREVKKVVEEKKKENIEIRKCVEVEKEPGELTDDENIVESSKEFQELTKVAFIESKFDRTLEANETFENDEPTDSGKAVQNVTKENQIRGDGAEGESKSQKGNENSGGELVEFSPFKNNYKLIEISPKKQKTKDHILDLYKINSQVPKIVIPPVNPILSSNKPGEKKILTSKEEKKQNEEVSGDNLLKVDEKIDGNEIGKIETKEKTSLPVDKKDTTQEEKITKKGNVQEKNLSEDKKKQNVESENNLGRGKRRGAGKKEITEPGEKNCKRRRGERESEEECETKKQKMSENCGRRTRSTKEKELEDEVSKEKMKEDISSFEFFKPITSKNETSGEQEAQVAETSSGSFKMSTTMSFTSVFCLETPIKSMEKLENLTINEQVMYQLNLNEKNGSFSPLITPRRMLKNDLMLTDSEDDSFVKVDPKENENKKETNEELQEEMEEEKEYSNSENSEYDSDSGASDFVDLLWPEKC